MTMETTGEHAEAIRKRLPDQAKKLSKPREANGESTGITLADDHGLVLEVFHADSPDLERQWGVWLRTAVKDTRWLYDQLQAAWQREERERQKRRVAP